MAIQVNNNIKSDITPIGDHVLVTHMEQGDVVTAGGIIIADDNGKDRGIRPRWCKVWKVGRKQTDVKPGEWILVEHGRWTWALDSDVHFDDDGKPLKIQRVDVTGIMMIADECPL